ncbi:MAG: SWIM zinc finger domain-containing protein, partial [Granulosicoccus sp.]
MNNQPRVLNFDDVIDLCGSVATSRGQVYKASGAVNELNWTAERNTLYAAVHDSKTAFFNTRITIAAHRFEGECTCPVRHNCKHVAAALLCWIEQQTAAPTADDHNLRAINRWLQKVVEQSRQAAPPGEHHEAGEPLLFYQLDKSQLSQHQPGITLQVLQTRLLKRGGYGKETPYRYNGHYYHPDWVLPSDRAILELAVGKQGDYSYRELTVSGDIGHLLMKKLVDSRRCYWGPERRQSLQAASVRTLEFDWQLGEADLYQFQTILPEVTEWELIPSDPPWYVDTVQLAAGQLENVPASGLLSQFMDAPPLPAAHAQEVSNYLASRLPDKRLPLPRKPNFVRVEQAPQPVLVLQSREDSVDIRDFFASIKFRYADYLLPFDGTDADATLEGKTPEGEPLVLKRDLSAEMNHAIDIAKQLPEFEPAQAQDSEFYSKADKKPRSKEVHRVAAAWKDLMSKRGELQT